MSTSQSTMSNVLKGIIAIKATSALAVVFLVLSCGGGLAACGVGGMIWSNALWRAALEAVEEAPADRVDPSLDGELVHVVAQATMNAPAGDELFMMNSDEAVGLVRVIETWQWVEKTETTSSGVGSNRRSTTNYVYRRDWAEGLIDSSTFHHSDGHTNPPQVEYQGLTVVGNGARLGAYTLSPAVIDALPTLDELPLDATDARRAEGELSNNRIHLHEDPQEPQLGDQRLFYRVLSPSVLSVMAVQDDGHFRAWEHDPSRPVLLAHQGSMTATELVWIERRKALFVGGLVASIGGAFCCFAALPTLIPLLLLVVVFRAWSRSKT